MFTVLLFVIAGLAAGYALRRRSVLRHLSRTTSITIFAMLFVLGYTCGSNPDIVSRFGDLGLQALAIAAAGSLASALAAMAVYRWGMKREKGGSDAR